LKPIKYSGKNDFKVTNEEKQEPDKKVVKEESKKGDEQIAIKYHLD
jgi:hypothetical protein